MNSLKISRTLSLLLLGLGLAANGYSQSFLTNGLVAYYPFNGNANDASGNGHNANVQGNYQYLPDGTLHLIGDGALFYSGGGYVALPDYGNLNSGFTISIWVGGETDHGNSIFAEYYFWFDDNISSSLYVYQHGSGIESPTGSAGLPLPITDFTPWKQIILVYSPGNFAGYLNGTNIGNASVTVGLAPLVNRAIGRHWWNGGANSSARMTMNVKDFRFYNRALSANEVSQLYAIESSSLTITNQPASVTANPGDTVNFTVGVNGSAPLNYQWFRDGNSIQSATNDTLTLTNVQPPRIGNYTVVVSNLSGSVTSSVANLSISNVNSALWQGLVAYYPFDGNANDASGNGNNGTISNAISAKDRFGSNSSSYRFNIANASYVRVASPAIPTGTNSRTVSMWINIDTINLSIFRAQFLFGYGDPLNTVHGNSFTMTVNNSLFFAMQGGFADFTIAGLGMFDSRWHMLTLTLMTNYVYGFLDGAPFSWNSFPPGGSSLNTTQSDLYIGSWAGQYFDGRIDDVRIYNRALSASEVSQLYSSEAPPPSPPSITAQPQDVLVNAHGTASFNVTANGTDPLSYHWVFHGSNSLNATDTTLSITNVRPANLGDYAVIVTNAYGSVTSSVANLYMRPFLQTPFGGSITYWGQTNILSVGAWGSGPLNFQWFKNGIAVTDATNATLTLSSIQFTNAGLYSVVVNSSFGSVTNAPYQVVVNPANVSLGLFPGVIISGTVGYTYRIQSTADLANTNSWVTLTNITLTAPLQIWNDNSTDTTQPNNPRRFYQVLPGQ